MSKQWGELRGAPLYYKCVEERAGESFVLVSVSCPKRMELTLDYA